MNETASAAAPGDMIAGALAHLARHMESGCPRSARAAAMLLNRIAIDVRADAHLCAHARELVEILERDDIPEMRREPVAAVAAP